ncbi:non-homologous end-joining DNA ligase [Desulfovirgula thermocuniculi]|uniref:non-homologous end-joining DNA ligase n=1 Tax=Desulfovirgula thermocuniculi TaxID=348842 RepID=UPI000486D455|nr:non-homologous end-joining DNA ligase [Desulfovirgula thermocuniculi]
MVKGNLPFVRSLRLTHPDKLLWPESGITKLEYVKYLYAVHEPLLRYTRGRTVTLIRYPNGIYGHSFYQKNCPRYAPAWVPRHPSNGAGAILLNDLPTLLWLGNQAALEFHVPFHEAKDHRPRELALDLDPSAPGFAQVTEVALLLRDTACRLGLPAYVKTSGATGLQVYIPLQPRYTYGDTRRVGAFLARYLAERYPRLVTVARRVGERGTRVYVDYLQHGPGRTLPAPYSPRGRPGAPVSTPLSWEELERGVDPAELNIRTVPERLRSLGDPFAPVTSGQGRASLDEILAFLAKRLPER